MTRGNPPPPLTDRQRQCLEGALALRSAKEIALDLGISHHAVEKHLRLARDKFGTATTAEAARRFAALEGKAEPYSGFSGLEQSRAGGDDGPVLDRPRRPAADEVEDATTGALALDPSLTPIQTLLAIVAVSLVSIVGLLLLIACAQGIEKLMMR